MLIGIKGPRRLRNIIVGGRVRVKPRSFLEQFQRQSRYQQISMDQLAVAGATDTVKGAGIHRDGYALLELTASPGLWHEDCLEFLEADKPTQQMAMLASERCIPAGEANSRNKIAMTEVLAVRRLYWEGEPHLEVLVSIGRPAEVPGPETWFHCPIQTSGLGKYDFVTTICGVDAFQAIELALRFVGSRLVEIDAKSGGRLRWLDGTLPKDWAQ